MNSDSPGGHELRDQHDWMNHIDKWDQNTLITLVAQHKAFLNLQSQFRLYCKFQPSVTRPEALVTCPCQSLSIFVILYIKKEQD